MNGIQPCSRRRALQFFIAATAPHAVLAYGFLTAFVILAVSNYVMQPPSMSASERPNRDKCGNCRAYLPALNTIYEVGERMAQSLLKGWPNYEHSIPYASH